MGAQAPGAHTGPWLGLGCALAQREWRMYTGPLAQYRQGQTRKGVALLSWEEWQGRVGQGTYQTGNAPPSPG